jgi:hypothetical protein
MGHADLFLVSANKGRRTGEWSDDDYDVREGAADGPVVGRIYKLSVAPTDNWWFGRSNYFLPSPPTAVRPRRWRNLRRSG